MYAQKVGLYRQRVTLQALVETDDNYGQPVQSWQAVATFWSEVRFLRGVELLNVKQGWATATHIISCRYQGPSFTPSPTMRFVLGKDNRIFNILAWQNIEERNRGWQFTCEEYVN
jgi:SPP1 family predicted phage head-tail adaptor